MVTKHQAAQTASSMAAKQPTVTADGTRTVTGINLDGSVFVRSFPNQQVMGNWLATTPVAEITSVR